MKSANKHLTLAAAVVLTAGILLGCPPEPEVEPNVSFVVSSILGETSPPLKGNGLCLQIDDNDISQLIVFIDEIQLERDVNGTSDFITVFSLTKAIDLTNGPDLTATALLPAGDYLSARVVVSNVQAAFDNDPNTLEDVALPNGGVFNLPLSLVIQPNGEGLFIIEFENVLCEQIGDMPEFNPTLDFLLATQIDDVEAVGEIEDDVFEGQLELEGTQFRANIDTSTALIFLPTDDQTPTGTQDDLDEDARVRVTGTLTAPNLLSADVIEIIEFGDDGGFFSS